ncbi:MAG: hypothetical protein ACLTY5_06210 [Angelakisella sp.]
MPLEKQLKMMEAILYLYDKCAALVAKRRARQPSAGRPALFDELVKVKYEVPNERNCASTAWTPCQNDIDAKLAAV